MRRLIQKIATIVLGGMLAAALVMFPKTVATAKNWSDGTANWSPGTWSPAGAPMTTGEAVNIVFSDGTLRTVTLNVSTPSLGLMTVDLTGSGTAASTLSMPNNNALTANAFFIGGYSGITMAQTAGRGAVTQSSGTTTVNTGDFALGYGANSAGTYTLSGTGALVANSSEYVGLFGNGTFNHSAGTNTIANNTYFFDIGTYAGSTGTYNLSGTGTLVSNTDEYIGDAGTGIFNQTGGSNTIIDDLSGLKLGFKLNSMGTYNLSGSGILSSANSVFIGGSGTGVFNQSGGTNYIGGVLIIGTVGGSKGTYTLSAGTLTTYLEEEIGNNGTGLFNQSGGLNTAFALNIGIGSETGTYTLSGGSVIANSFVVVGYDSDGTVSTGVMNVSGTGALTGRLTIYNTPGTSVNLSGGTINAAALNFNGTPSLFNWTGGTLNVTQSVTWDSAAAGTTTSAAFGAGRSLGINQTLTINGDETLGGTGAFSLTLGSGSTHTVTGFTTIASNGVLTLDGGTLNIGMLANNGSLNFIAGTLNVNQDGAWVNSPIVTGNPSTINVNANNIILGSAASFTGFNHQGVLNVGANTVTLNSAGYARLGVLTSLAGGTINAPNGVYLSGGGNLVGNGSVSARFTGDSGSVIEASGSLVLGDTASPAGFNDAGELRTKQFAVTLNNSGPSTLGSLTTLGSGANPGTLSASNGYVVDFGRSVTGFGTIDSTNTLAKHATINGTVQGISVGQPITLSGYIKGTGTFTNVSFTGTFSPGLSPTITSAGNLALASSSTLEMELGGITAGTAYDEIQATGALALGGTLHVSVINGFVPTAGQAFDILDWGTLSGTFSSISLPTLSGLTWNTSQLYTTGVISVASAGLPGDYNNNGVVDASDYVVWRANQGTTNVLANDPIGGAIGVAQYNQWRTHFGQSAASGSGVGARAAIPEPPTALLLLFTATGWCLRRRRAA